MFKRSVTIKLLGLLVPLGVALLSSMPNEATAAQLRGFTIAPNWALGSPQTPRIFAPGEFDPFRVFGHFGLGPAVGRTRFFASDPRHHGGLALRKPTPICSRTAGSRQ